MVLPAVPCGDPAGAKMQKVARGSALPSESQLEWCSTTCKHSLPDPPDSSPDRMNRLIMQNTFQVTRVIPTGISTEGCEERERAECVSIIPRGRTNGGPSENKKKRKKKKT